MLALLAGKRYTNQLIVKRFSVMADGEAIRTT
jgi:hypothetical protein